MPFQDEHSDEQPSARQGTPARDPARGTASGATSPELVLVSPELGEAARRRLPDRPWEAAGAQPPVSVPGDPESPPPPRAGEPRRGRRGLALVAVTAVGVLALAGAGLDVWTSESTERIDSDGASPASEGQPGVEALSPLWPRAGYVVTPGGSFLTDASGRTITSFTLPVRCGRSARPLVIRDIAVAGRTFRFSGKAVGRAIVVRLRGRIVRREQVRGVVAVEGPACSLRSVEFSARAS